MNKFKIKHGKTKYVILNGEQISDWVMQKLVDEYLLVVSMNLIVDLCTIFCQLAANRYYSQVA